MKKLTPSQRKRGKLLLRKLKKERLEILQDQESLATRQCRLSREFHDVVVRLAVCSNILDDARVGVWPDWFRDAVGSKDEKK